MNCSIEKRGVDPSAILLNVTHVSFIVGDAEDQLSATYHKSEKGRLPKSLS